MMIENLEERRLMSVSIGSVDASVRTVSSDQGLLGAGVLKVIVGQVVKAIGDATAQAPRMRASSPKRSSASASPRVWTTNERAGRSQDPQGPAARDFERPTRRPILLSPNVQ